MRAAVHPANFDFHELAHHFLSLSSADRLLRFGWVSSDLEMVSYADALLRASDTVFVVVEPTMSITRVVQLEVTDGGANLGLSVSHWCRRQGIGTLLLERAGSA